TTAVRGAMVLGALLMRRHHPGRTAGGTSWECSFETNLLKSSEQVEILPHGGKSRVGTRPTQGLPVENSGRRGAGNRRLRINVVDPKHQVLRINHLVPRNGV